MSEPKLRMRKNAERGHFDHGWLESWHTFSFADYHDSKWIHFRTLRVINEDKIQPAEGFPTHAHRDMEIITYILSGALEHQDSMGNGSVIHPGEVQYMSAGSGITHSEFNALKDGLTHLLQIWILPNEKNAEPRYNQKDFPREEKLNRLRLIVSEDGSQGSIAIRQDARIYASVLEPGKTLEHPLAPGHAAWIQVTSGEISLGEIALKSGDALGIESASLLQIQNPGSKEAEFLLFDLA